MLVFNLPAFESKNYAAYDRFHGNGPYGEIPTEKGPISTLGFALPYNKYVKWTNDSAGGHCYSFYLDLTVLDVYKDPCFSFDGLFSLPIFFLWRKNEENLSTRSLNVLQNARSNFVLFSSSFRQFQMPFEGVLLILSFVKTLVKLGIIYATDPLLQNTTKIVCLRWLTFDFFNYNFLWTML